MKTTAISGDLLVKLAVGAVAVGGAYYLSKKAAGAVGDAVAGATEKVLHPFPEFDKTIQGYWDKLTGKTTATGPAVDPVTGEPLPFEPGIKDTSGGWQ